MTAAETRGRHRTVGKAKKLAFVSAWPGAALPPAMIASRARSAMRALITVALVAMALAFAPMHTAEAAGDVALPSAAAGAAASGVRYFILIDAGSTGSRAHVHEYTVDAARPLPIVEESKNKKIKPGLSSYAPNPPAVSASIQDLLAFIKTVVPQDQWAVTPLHLQATAGLRSVTPAEAAAVLEVVRNDLEVSGFLFERSWARIISGEQEGINGWMAVNYLLGVFDTHGDGKSPAPPSTGVVEMGGSSMQITFAPRTPTPEDRKQLSEVRVAGSSYWLYTHSFLQYGLQAAEKLYQRLAIQEIEERGNPCYPKAFRHSSIGDFDHCTNLLSTVVDKSIKCPAVSCSFNGVYQPKIVDEHFLAIENFYYTAKFFGNAEEQDFSQKQNQQTSVAAAPAGNQFIGGLRAKGKEFCNQEWNVLVKQYEKTPADELKAFCFSAAYQSVVLESGLGFSQGTNLRVAKTIRGKGIDWEMGATLFELLPKDPAALAKAAAEAEAARKAKNQAQQPGLMDDSEFGLVHPSSRRGSGAALLDPTSTHSRFCPTCALYTVLIAAAIVLVYVGWTRYSKQRAGTLMPSYSQSAFNRV